MLGMCRIPEEISYSSDGVAEPQPQCLMHKQVVFLAKASGWGGVGWGGGWATTTKGRVDK